MRLFFKLIIICLCAVSALPAAAQVPEPTAEQQESRAAYLKMLKERQPVAFDISSMLDFREPANMATIRDSMQKHCGAKLYTVFLCADPARARRWQQEERLNTDAKRRSFAMDLLMDIDRACPKTQGRYNTAWIYAPEPKLRVMLYMID